MSPSKSTSASPPAALPQSLSPTSARCAPVVEPESPPLDPKCLATFRAMHRILPPPFESPKDASVLFDTPGRDFKKGVIMRTPTEPAVFTVFGVFSPDATLTAVGNGAPPDGSDKSIQKIRNAKHKFALEMPDSAPQDIGDRFVDDAILAVNIALLNSEGLPEGVELMSRGNYPKTTNKFYLPHARQSLGAIFSSDVFTRRFNAKTGYAKRYDTSSANDAPAAVETLLTHPERDPENAFGLVSSAGKATLQFANVFRSLDAKGNIISITKLRELICLGPQKYGRAAGHLEGFSGKEGYTWRFRPFEVQVYGEAFVPRVQGTKRAADDSDDSDDAGSKPRPAKRPLLLSLDEILASALADDFGCEFSESSSTPGASSSQPQSGGTSASTSFSGFDSEVGDRAEDSPMTEVL